MKLYFKKCKYFTGIRQYDAEIGRWSAIDPALQAASPYMAMGNNPMIYIDADGRTWKIFKPFVKAWDYVWGKANELAQWAEANGIPSVDIGMSYNNLGELKPYGNINGYPLFNNEVQYEIASQNAVDAINDARGDYFSQQANNANHDQMVMNNIMPVASNGGDAQTLFLLGLGLTTDAAENIANLFQLSNAEVKAAGVRNNRPTDRIDRTMGRTSRFATGVKWLGRGVIVAGSIISINQGYDAFSRGDMAGAKKAGLDLGVGLGTAAIGGIPGVVLYGGYMLMMQPVGPGTGYQHPNTFLRDNTYIAPPVSPIY